MVTTSLVKRRSSRGLYSAGLKLSELSSTKPPPHEHTRRPLWPHRDHPALGAGTGHRHLVLGGSVHERPAVFAIAAQALQLAQMGWRQHLDAVGAALAVAADAPSAARPAGAGLAATRSPRHPHPAVPVVLRGTAGRLGLQLGRRVSDRAVRRAAAARFRVAEQGA